MGTRIIAATVIVAIGAIAIYDATFVLPSSRSGDGKDGDVKERTVLTAFEPVSPDAAADVADTGAAQGQSYVEDGAAESGAGDSGDVIARFDPLRQFPDKWRDPFASKGYTTPPQPHLAGETTPATPAHSAVDPFAGYEPHVQAVMITATHRRVILDRLVLSEGDAVPGTGSTVHKVLPHGVELEKNDIVKFYPMD